MSYEIFENMNQKIMSVIDEFLSKIDLQDIINELIRSAVDLAFRERPKREAADMIRGALSIALEAHV